MSTIKQPSKSILPSYAKPDERLSDTDLAAIMTNALPAYAYRGGAREWTWTRPSGVWHLNLVFGEDRDASVKARLDGNPSLLQCCVRTSRREINALLRWLILVDAIDRHPDDPYAHEESAS